MFAVPIKELSEFNYTTQEIAPTHQPTYNYLFGKLELIQEIGAVFSILVKRCVFVLMATSSNMETDPRDIIKNKQLQIKVHLNIGELNTIAAE